MWISIRGSEVLSVELELPRGAASVCQVNCQNSLQDFLVLMFITVIPYREHLVVCHIAICLTTKRVLIGHLNLSPLSLSANEYFMSLSSLLKIWTSIFLFSVLHDSCLLREYEKCYVKTFEVLEMVVGKCKQNVNSKITVDLKIHI